MGFGMLSEPTVGKCTTTSRRNTRTARVEHFILIGYIKYWKMNDFREKQNEKNQF